MHYECWLHSEAVRGTLRSDSGDLAGPAFCSPRQQSRRARLIVWKGTVLDELGFRKGGVTTRVNIRASEPKKGLSDRSVVNDGKQLSDRVTYPVGFDIMDGRVMVVLKIWFVCLH